MAPDVQIETYQTQNFSGTFFKNKVASDMPWDKLSKIFKKYTYTIEYTSGHYRPSDYSISVYTKQSHGYEFRLNKPYQKVENVEVYFMATDTSNTNPLILGFIYGEGISKSYYTWSNLKSKRECSGLIDVVESITDKDLITGLLEEVGSRIHRPNKLVISLNEQPDEGGGGGRSKYPDSGHFKSKKITVKKESTDVLGYDKYVHTVGSRDISEFYVSYKNNSRYFKIVHRSGYSNLVSVTAYFETGGSNKLVLFLLYVGRGTHVYTYYDFVKDLQVVNYGNASTAIKTITESGTIGPGSGLVARLQQESERLKPLITFKKDGPNLSENENISTDTQNIDLLGEKFQKVVMTPKTDDVKGGSSVGPWTVYNSNLFTLERVKKLPEDGVLTPVITSSNNNIKYSMITVYYSTKSNDDSDHKALLAEFVPGPGLSISSLGSDTKLYIKRKDKDGNTWANESASSIGTSVDDRVLTDIARTTGIIVVSPGYPSSSNTEINEAVGSTGDSENQDNKKDGESDGDSISKLKLAGAGVATTAIGAGAIGGGAHYAHGVIGVINWLV